MPVQHSGCARGTRARRRSAEPPRGGILVAVVGEEGRGKEMLVQIARRRFEADASLAFPARVTTRSLGAGCGDVPVSRRTFRDMIAAGAFLSHWETGGHGFGLGLEALDALEAGRTVIVVAGREAAARLGAIWPDVRTVEVKAGPDTAIPARASGPASGSRVAAAAGRELSVRHQGDVATAVRLFHELIGAMRLERLSDGAPVPSHRGRSLGRMAVSGTRAVPGPSGHLRSARHRA